MNKKLIFAAMVIIVLITIYTGQSILQNFGSVTDKNISIEFNNVKEDNSTWRLYLKYINKNNNLTQYSITLVNKINPDDNIVFTRLIGGRPGIRLGLMTITKLSICFSDVNDDWVLNETDWFSIHYIEPKKDITVVFKLYLHEKIIYESDFNLK